MITLPDTNVILRYLLSDVPNQHQDAVEFFEKVRTGKEKAFILESVLVECVYVLFKYYKAPKKEISDKLSALLHYRGIVNKDAADCITALSLFEKKNIDIVDCLLYAKSRKDNYRLFSFDEKLKKLK
jgi:predicted nucleic-acid-binding protein